MPALPPPPVAPSRRSLAAATLLAALAASGAHAQRVVPAAQADITFFAPFEGDFAGGYVSGQVALLGDLDGDGYGEFLLSTANTLPASNLPGPGRTYVVSGLTHLPIYTFEGQPVPPGNSVDQLGVSADNAGDVDGDGINDIIIGSQSPFALRRGVVYSGATGLLQFIYPAQLPGAFGAGVVGVGDLDVDGHADVAVTDGFRTFVYSGSGTGTYSAVVHSPAAAGDVNNDGFNDFVAVSINGILVISGADGSGIHLIHHGPMGGPAVSGRQCAGVGDLNADGFDDFAGCWSDVVLVYSGADESILLTISDGRNDPDRSIRAAGDINADGVPDILVASPSTETEDSQVRLYSGRTGACMTVFTEPSRLERFALATGGAVAGEHDVNADGRPDIIIRSFRGIPTAGLEGPVAYVYFSPTPCPADITFDRAVDMHDLALLLSQFPLSRAYPGLDADIDLDGRVSFADLNMLLAAYGTSCDD